MTKAQTAFDKAYSDALSSLGGWVLGIALAITIVWIFS